MILPGFKSLCDSGAEALRSYAQDGGSLVISGPAGTHSDVGPERPAPIFADLLGGTPPGEELAVTPIGEGTVVSCPRRFADADLPDGFSTTDYKVSRPQTYGGKSRGPLIPVSVAANRDLFLHALDLAAGRDLSLMDVPDAPGLRVAGRYRIDSEQPSLTVHIINEQMAMRHDDTGGYFMLAEDGTPGSCAELTLSIPLPDGYRAAQVTWAQMPQSDPQELAFKPLADGIVCTVPEVELYSIVRVKLQPGAGAGETIAGTVSATQTPHPSQGIYVPDAEAPSLHPIALTDAAVGGDPIRLNYTHPSLIYATAGDTVSVRVAAFGSEGKWARWWIAAPDGTLLRTGAVACGSSEDLDFVAQTEGVYLVQAQADADDIAISSTTHGICLPASPSQRVNFRGQPPTLYFHVPPDRDTIALRLQSRDREGGYEIADSQGRTMALRDGLGQTTVMDPGGAMVWSEKSSGAVYQRVEIPVPEGEAGAIWSLKFTAGKPDSATVSNFYFDDDLPALVSTSPAALLVP